MVGGHSMGLGLQLIGGRFLNFLLGKLSREFKLCYVHISGHSNGHISVLREAIVTCLGMLLVLRVLYMSM